MAISPERSARRSLVFSRQPGQTHVHLTSETEHRAYYRPGTNSVYIPLSRFVDAPHYYSTLFHELVHSTGHETCLNRTFGAHFGDELYSKEELVVEMGAAFLCAIAEIANEHTSHCLHAPGLSATGDFK
jgi:antirestriction protein ArdC